MKKILYSIMSLGFIYIILFSLIFKIEDDEMAFGMHDKSKDELVIIGPCYRGKLAYSLYENRSIERYLHYIFMPICKLWSVTYATSDTQLIEYK